MSASLLPLIFSGKLLLHLSIFTFPFQTRNIEGTLESYHLSLPNLRLISLTAQIFFSYLFFIHSQFSNSYVLSYTLTIFKGDSLYIYICVSVCSMNLLICSFYILKTVYLCILLDLTSTANSRWQCTMEIYCIY